MFDVEKMKKIYFDWIDKKIQFVPSKNQDYMTITTPFLDMYLKIESTKIKLKSCHYWAFL